MPFDRTPSTAKPSHHHSRLRHDDDPQKIEDAITNALEGFKKNPTYTDFFSLFKKSCELRHPNKRYYRLKKIIDAAWDAKLFSESLLSLFKTIQNQNPLKKFPPFSLHESKAFLSFLSYHLLLSVQKNKKHHSAWLPDPIRDLVYGFFHDIETLTASPISPDALSDAYERYNVLLKGAEELQRQHDSPPSISAVPAAIPASAVPAASPTSAAPPASPASAAPPASPASAAPPAGPASAAPAASPTSAAPAASPTSAAPPAGPTSVVPAWAEPTDADAGSRPSRMASSSEPPADLPAEDRSSIRETTDKTAISLWGQRGRKPTTEALDDVDEADASERLPSRADQGHRSKRRSTLMLPMPRTQEGERVKRGTLSRVAESLSEILSQLPDLTSLAIRLQTAEAELQTLHKEIADVKALASGWRERADDLDRQNRANEDEKNLFSKQLTEQKQRTEIAIKTKLAEALSDPLDLLFSLLGDQGDDSDFEAIRQEAEKVTAVLGLVPLGKNGQIDTYDGKELVSISRKDTLKEGDRIKQTKLGWKLLLPDGSERTVIRRTVVKSVSRP